MDDLRELADLARSVRTERLEPPPPHVWQGVVDELGLSPRSRPRAAPWAWAVAAAVAGVVAGSLVTWALVDDDDAPVAAPEVVRTAELERLAGTGDGGTARLLQDADGRQTVEVERARPRVRRRPLRGLADPPRQHADGLHRRARSR